MNTFTHKTTENKAYSSLIIELSFEQSFVDTFNKQALNYFRNNVTLDGFRKGTIPDTIILQKIGKEALNQKASDFAFEHAYLETLPKIEQNIIGKPMIHEKKSDKDSEFIFEITCDVLPVITFDNYKKNITNVNNESRKKDHTPTPKETEDSILEFRKYLAYQSKHDRWHKENKTDTHTGHGHPEIEDITDADLPELTDELISQSTGFKDMPELISKLTESIITQKIKRETDIQKELILESLSGLVNIQAPNSLIAYELQNIMTEFEHDLSSQGIKKDEYLTHIGKSETELLDSWKENASKKALQQLIIDALAKQEKITPTEDEITEQVNAMKTQYGMLKNFDETRAQSYVTMLLTNQKVFEFLIKL